MSPGTGARIFLRSLLINAAWNFPKMQNIGFLYALTPLADALGERGKVLLSRHTDAFSTHPYMASLIIGSVARLEAQEDGDGADAIHQKQALMGPYAAMGDPFFWGALLPVSSVVAVIVALWGSIAAPIVFIILYNSVHLWIRTRGFIDGWRNGAGALEFLKCLALPDKTRKLKWCSLVMLAFLAGSLFICYQSVDFIFSDIVRGLLVLAAIFLVLFLRSRRISSLAILYAASILFFVVAF